MYGTDYPEPVDPGPDDNPTRPAGGDSAYVQSRLILGGAFILDAPDHVPSVWGRGDQVLWAEGEALILAGSPGVGKTTLGGQLVRGRIVGGEVLGLPVEPTATRVLYLAMDRPRQIARALRRTLGDLPRDLLNERLRVWQGPPVADIAKHPDTLKGYADLAGADTIVLDSLKDAAIGLTEDEVGAGYNRARQICIAAGIEVLELHHLVKRGANGGRPTTLADLYGSTWLTSGAGSVVLLAGDAGDPIVEMLHLKTPAAEVGPWRVIHDHDAGTSNIWHSTDLVMMAKVKGAAGLTAKAAAIALFSAEKPTPAQVEKARRKLDALARGGHLAFIEGDRASARAAVWTFTDTFTHLIEPVTLHAAEEASRPAESEHGNTFTDTFTTITQPDLHASPLSCKEGEGESVACLDCNTPLGELRRAYSDRCADCDRRASA